MSIAVMKQAIEAFEQLKKEVTRDGEVSENWDAYYAKEYHALEALRKAVAQTETQKPVAYRLNVAGIWHFIDAEHAQRIPEECEPLYTALELK